MRKILTALLVLNQFVPPLFAYRGEVENISPRLYSETVQREMARAKTSISLYMYLLSFQPNESKSQVFKLVQSLKEAHDRGVKVEVVLDQNFNFAGEEGAAGEGKNLAAYTFLKASGIPVYFDEAGTYTHAKALIIDEETVITGSSNWTRAALDLNEEANVLIRSKEVARDMLKALGAIKRGGPAEVGPVVNVPADFLLDKDLLGRMVSQPDERAFDVYLYLVWRSGPKVILDYGKLAEHLGIGSMGENAYDRQINKTLTKLEERYGLIRATTTYGKDAEVTLLPLKTQDFVQVPAAYWDWRWNRRLSFAGKIFYLINLREAAASPIQPRWSLHNQTLARRYGVSPWFITRGVTELRRANLLEVEYDEVGLNGPSDRAPNVYTLNSLYDPRELDGKLEALKKQYGAEKVERARRLAALVYEDSYLHGIEQLIELEDQYGLAKIEEAEKILGAKSPDNPKRNIGYLIRMIQNLK